MNKYNQEILNTFQISRDFINNSMLEYTEHIWHISPSLIIKSMAIYISQYSCMQLKWIMKTLMWRVTDTALLYISGCLRI